MKSCLLKSLPLLILLTAGFLQGQDRDLPRDLDRLRTMLERTATVIELLPEGTDGNIKQTLRLHLEEAQRKYQEAIDAAHNGQPARARLLIAQVFAILRQIEAMIKSHPVFRINFREELDRKIQQAEIFVERTQNREALYMLNRSKFFREKAFSSFEQGRTYAAIEYYRLAVHFADQVQRMDRGQTDIPNEDDWRNFYLDTQVLLERARAVAENTGQDAPVQRMLNQAETELKDVAHLYEQHRYSAARQKLITVNRALYRLIDLAEKVPQRDDERLDVDLGSIELALEGIKEKLNQQDLPAAQRLLSRTEELVQQVHRHIENHQPVLARRKLFLANQLVLKLYRLADVQPADQPGELADQLAAAEHDVQLLKEQPADFPGSAGLLELIDSNLRSAREAYDQKLYYRASYALQVTNRLILKYNRLQLRDTAGQVQKEVVAADLEQLSGLLDRLKDSSDSDRDFAVRYQNAEALYRIARDNFNKGDFLVSRELTQMAINLLTK